MPRLAANGIDLEYRSFGAATARPLILLRGLGTQLIHWDEAFCKTLADRGHFVVIFDNRDVGLSTWFDEHGVPDVAEIMAQARAGQTPDTPYRMDDMADDVIGVLDALSLESAHILGISMGGMIVQAAAIRHPDRIRSMTSIMSSTGHPGLPQARPEVMRVLMEPTPSDREGYIDQTVAAARVFGSTGFPFDEAAQRDVAGRAFDRAYHPDGIARQMAAIVSAGSRRPAIESVRLPALVIHGNADPLVPIEGGRDTADAIPGAQFVEIDGMGHDLPPGAWPQLIDAIASFTEKAEAQTA